MLLTHVQCCVSVSSFSPCKVQELHTSDYCINMLGVSHQIPHEYVVRLSTVPWLVLDCLLLPASGIPEGVLVTISLLL